MWAVGSIRIGWSGVCLIWGSGSLANTCFYKEAPREISFVAARPKSSKKIDGIQRVPALLAFWDLEKTVLHEICVNGTVGGPPTNAKIPHLHVHKPKTTVVGSAVVKTMLVIFV